MNVKPTGLARPDATRTALTPAATAALAAPGVVGTYVATDLGLAPLPASGTVERAAEGELEGLFSREPLARDVVRFVGEIVAVVVAGTIVQAVDAAALGGG